MGIDKKWLIIGGILIVLLVAFGRNPVQEAAKRAELARKGKDPLVEAINEHNTKRGLSGGMRNGLPPGATRLPVQVPAADGSAPSYMMRSTQEYIPPGGYPKNNSLYPQADQPQQPPSYYPPPAPGARQAVPGPQSFNVHQRLSNGKPVSFAGTQVFTQDAKGNVVPMPDGTYTMYDGQVKIVVRGGHHTIISN